MSFVTFGRQHTSGHGFRHTHTMVEDGGWWSNAKMMIRLLSLSLRVGQVGLEELGHAEGADLVLPEDWLHLGVGLEVLLVLGVLELVRLEVGPDPLDHLWSGQLLPLLGTDQVGQLAAQSQRLRQSGSLRHFVGFSR